MTCKFPSFCFHGICYSSCFLHFLIKVKIRMFFQEFLLVILKVLACLIRTICTISQHTVISGHRQNSFSSMVREIWMFFYKSIDQRNHIIVPGRNASVILDIFILHFTILVHNKLRSKSISIHIVIITHIVLRKYKRDLTRRKHNAASGHCSILIYNRHIVRADHYIALIIHTLYDLVKFINRCHYLVVIPGFIISVKCLAGVFDQCMVKNMCHLIKRPGNTGVLLLLINFNCMLEFLTCLICVAGLKHLYRFIIIILIRRMFGTSVKSLILFA